ncbi:MAG: AMP-binding protein, partial [Firmicutes bacterium]|nr:AMP-binding protein [Bacillota bacterium]
LSQRNICFNLSEMCQMAYIGPDDTFLSVLPLHHTYECTCGFLCPLYRGSSIAYCEKLSLITKTMQEVHPTVILCVPLLMDTMYKRIWAGAEKKGVADKLRKAIKLNNALKKVGIDMSGKLFASVHENFGGKLRLLVSGGAAANPEVLKGLRDLGILAIQGYGLTECAPLAAVNRDIFFCDSSAGLATPHGAFDVFEPDQNGIGEIRYKGDNVMLGYYNAPELTAETIRDGWFYTGDSGFIDKDGFVHITGRKKNVIVTHNGKNIFPEEIEEYIARIPLVADSMVVGEEDGDDLVVKAIIYPNYEEAEKLISADPDTQEYKDALKKLFYERINEINLTLPPYKRIRRIFIRKNEFDRTTTKKIKRFSEENKHGEEL